MRLIPEIGVILCLLRDPVLRSPIVIVSALFEQFSTIACHWARRNPSRDSADVRYAIIDHISVAGHDARGISLDNWQPVVITRFSFRWANGTLIPAVPIDHIQQFLAIHIGAQVLAKDLNTAMPILVAGA